MPRVLLFTTDLETGGTPTVVRELARRLPDDHFETAVACLGGTGPIADLIREDGVGVETFGLTPRQLPTAVRRLRRLVREQGVDVVLSFLVHANVVAALARGRSDGVRWWQSIQTTQPEPRWHWRAQALAQLRADGVIVPSFGVADVAATRSRVPDGKLRIVPNAVDAATIVDTPRPPREAGSPLRAVFLGRLDPIKRVPLLASTVASLPNVTLDVYGDGPDRAAVEAVGAMASDRVRLHGFATRETALANADVLVLPSAAEGFGLVLIEAMAAGVPIIGSDIGGIRDVVRDGETGLLAGEGELASCLAKVRDDPTAANRRAIAAIDDVAERFTWDRTIPRYRELLG